MNFSLGISVHAGAIIGLAPPLHRLFFNSPEKGGYLKAWLTESVQNIGSLFPALQLVVVGAKLSSSLTKVKKGEASGPVPWIPMLSISFIRFIMWPA
jgi:auxin efflux carrier family protein